MFSKITKLNNKIWHKKFICTNFKLGLEEVSPLGFVEVSHIEAIAHDIFIYRLVKRLSLPNK